MSVPAVSVIVPVYNRRDVIGRAVGSLLAQDFDKAVEIIVVDDGSKDGSAEVVKNMDSRLHLIRQRNRGAAAARQTGVQAARADAVAFLDSDDVALPWHLSELWAGLHRRPDVVLAFAQIADMAGTVPEYLPLNLDRDGIMPDPLVDLLLRGCLTASMNLMTYRRHALFACHRRDRILASNDYDFSLRIATRGSFAYVDRPTMHCERRSDGISHSRGALQVGFGVLAVTDAVRLSARCDDAVRDALRRRLEVVWPFASVQLIAQGYFRHSLHVGLLGMRYARWVPSLRGLWWALDHTAKAAAG